MMRFLVAVAAALGLVLGLNVAAQAFPPPYDRFLPQKDLSPIVPQVKADGEFTYRAINNSGVLPRFKTQVFQALDSASPKATSYGRTVEDWITIRSDPDPMMIARAESTAVFATACNSEWAIGCAQWWLPQSVTWYRAPAMIYWGDGSVEAVVIHETHHVLSVACDQYRQGDPTGDIADPDDECNAYGTGASAVCTGNPDTVMDCGGASPVLTPYDVETFLILYDFAQVDPDSCPGPANSHGLRWDPCADNHEGGKGLWVSSGEWDYCPGCEYTIGPLVYVGEWFTKAGISEWGTQADYGAAVGFARWNKRLAEWVGVFVKRCFFDPPGPWVNSVGGQC